VLPVTSGIQPDQYEIDNAATRATTIDSSVSQTRNFHNADDDDWIRIVLDKPQSITIATVGTNLADTQLFLYDSNLQELDYSANTEGVITEEGFAYLPIESYVLNVTLDNDSVPAVDMSPILMLLLDD